jgi:hypothetical protein
MPSQIASPAYCLTLRTVKKDDFQSAFTGCDQSICERLKELGAWNTMDLGLF